MLLDDFFSAVRSGDRARLFRLLHDDAVLVAGQAVASPPLDRICGTYQGAERITAFFDRLTALFVIERFEIQHQLEGYGVAFASGCLAYRVKDTGRLFESDWCVRCQIIDGKIQNYRFFEDTDALSKALSG